MLLRDHPGAEQAIIPISAEIGRCLRWWIFAVVGDAISGYLSITTAGLAPNSPFSM
jgi:hypothetical protein